MEHLIKRLHCKLHGHMWKEERKFLKPTKPRLQNLYNDQSKIEKYGFTQIVRTCECCDERVAIQAIGDFTVSQEPVPTTTEEDGPLDANGVHGY